MPDSEDEDDNMQHLKKEIDTRDGELRANLQRVPRPTKNSST